MKISMTLSGDSIEDEEEILVAMQGSKYRHVITDVLEWLRQNYKYEKGDIPVEQAEVVKDFIWGVLKEWNLEV